MPHRSERRPTARALAIPPTLPLAGSLRERVTVAVLTTILLLLALV